MRTKKVACWFYDRAFVRTVGEGKPYGAELNWQRSKIIVIVDDKSCHKNDRIFTKFLCLFIFNLV
ncbi:hypothetical protein [Candidatus Odyssella thessalonicensis]|uniref:hypothetical protein n=1 Tax=Candidatus Odyssella thessalonicensis TaxID=84647 RepID=UPI000225C1BB|nr:hypothetical protein [Candidatus Odyssella thessalonicensis]